MNQIYRGFDITKGNDEQWHIAKNGVWVGRFSSEELAMGEVDRLKRAALNAAAGITEKTA